jgi:hypothetical protein
MMRDEGGERLGPSAHPFPRGTAGSDCLLEGSEVSHDAALREAAPSSSGFESDHAPEGAPSSIPENDGHLLRLRVEAAVSMQFALADGSGSAVA